MDSLAERVLFHVRRQELLRAGDRVGVAVSGGIDSVALLRVLLELRGELGIVLSVVHFNHRLRGAESDGDQEFVAGLAREYDLEFFVDGDDVAGRAAEERVSVEAAARDLRYGFFQSLLAGDGPQGLKPDLVSPALRGPEGPLFHGAYLRRIATGHTLDDQAETVLMRMIRGSGVRGVGGIHPRILVEDDDGEISGEIVRPLLNVRHRELEGYLEDIGQPWREDSTNADGRFTRNRIRSLVVPLLEKEFNPSVAENLAELAEIARGEEDYWENEVSGWLGTVVQWSEPEWAPAVSAGEGLVQIAGLGDLLGGAVEIPTLRQAQGRLSRAEDAREMGHPARLGADDLRLRIADAPWLVMNASVNRMWFLGESVAVQRRLVKAIGENAGISLEFKHVEEILRIAAEDGAAGRELSLPLGWKVVVEPGEVRFVTPDLRGPEVPHEYEYELHVPGKVVVYEAGSAIEVRAIPAGAEAAYNPDQLLDAESIPGSLRVRNWRPGDRYWPAHTKSPKKIKELLQERHVAQPERRLWPVMVSGDEIVWVRGFPLPAKFRAKVGRAAMVILETGLDAGE
ncbi:MAG TPA: tRNA lysidine(34) synthetase TilS [Candidatus Binatus sp.]|nr:tRNA lysidine(34) synthetase TilS [Candidatus Binatus sp.]